MKTFNEFLEERFMNLREYRGVGITKDNCESLLEGWLESLDIQEVIDYGEFYGKTQFIDGQLDGLNKGKAIMNSTDVMGEVLKSINPN